MDEHQAQLALEFLASIAASLVNMVEALDALGQKLDTLIEAIESQEAATFKP